MRKSFLKTNLWTMINNNAQSETGETNRIDCNHSDGSRGSTRCASKQFITANLKE